MNRRRQAYYGALKFYFQTAIYAGATDFRAVYSKAKNDASAYAFQAPTENLTVWIPVWARAR